MSWSFPGRIPARVLALVMALILLVPARPASALTYEDERAMGRQVLVAVKKHTKLVDDQVINDYVRQLGQKIVRAIGPQPFEYQFFVIESGVLNAFAVPGGYVFLHSETINAMESEGQVAAILCHEIAHVAGRHIANRIARSRAVSLAALAGLMAGILIGGQAGAALMMGSMGGGMQAMLAYSREDEQEADLRGTDFLVQAGYDPRFMASSFQVMLKKAYYGSTGIPTYLNTHPGLSERIGAVEAAVKAHPGYGRVLGRGDEKAFRAIKDRVMALLADPNRARNYFEARLKQDRGSGSGHYGLAMLHHREQRYEQAVKELNLALKVEPANANYLTDLGAILYQKRDMDGALNALGKAVVLRPHFGRALFLLGQVYEEKGLMDQAQLYYERALVEDPDNAQTLFHLGNLYGRRGDLARAHLHTGLYFKAEGEMGKAMYHLEKAKENAAAAPPDVRERIDSAITAIKKDKKEPKGNEPNTPPRAVTKMLP
ncbi:MAG: M48 family metalloprotease [Thermodesulfobacteriota bacterium]